MQERLQKIIARAGVASRRHAEKLIVSGQVTVNGRVVVELGTKANAERDHIKVSGKLLRFPEEKLYVMLHKPAGAVATMSDPEGRRSLRDFLHGVPGRVFPVGRLEYHAAGLLLLTNDGELANRILRAGRLAQTYEIKVKGQLTPAESQQLARTAGARLRRMEAAPNPWYEVILNDPRSDTLRAGLLRAGHPVEKLRRVRLGNLELDSLPPGRYRLLTQEEVTGLSRAVARATNGSARRVSESALTAVAPRAANQPGRRGARQRPGRRFTKQRGHKTE